MYKIIHVISRRIRWDTRIYLEGQAGHGGGTAGRKLERGDGGHTLIPQSNFITPMEPPCGNLKFSQTIVILWKYSYTFRQGIFLDEES